METHVIDLTEEDVIELCDEEEVDDNEILTRILPDQRKELKKICRSFFGQQFRDTSSIILRSLSSVLQKIREDEYSGQAEAAQDCVEILDSYIQFYRHCPNSRCGKFSSDELVCMAQHLKLKFHELTQLPPSRSASLESALQQFPLTGPEKGKYHNFEELNVHHYYIATSQYFKMLCKTPPCKKHKKITNVLESIESIEYVVNKKTLEAYNQQKRKFEFSGKVNGEGGVREILLFHGTDSNNIESIVENNFDIDRVPSHKQKAMVHGRGVYMSEHPEISFKYGNQLLLCKVLPGQVEHVEGLHSGLKTFADGCDSRELSLDGVGVIHVIKNTTQILPYCVIHLQRSRIRDQESQSRPFGNIFNISNIQPPSVVQHNQFQTVSAQPTQNSTFLQANNAVGNLSQSSQNTNATSNCANKLFLQTLYGSSSTQTPSNNGVSHASLSNNLSIPNVSISPNNQFTRHFPNPSLSTRNRLLIEKFHKKYRLKQASNLNQAYDLPGIQLLGPSLVQGALLNLPSVPQSSQSSNCSPTQTLPNQPPPPAKPPGPSSSVTQTHSIPVSGLAPGSGTASIVSGSKNSSVNTIQTRIKIGKIKLKRLLTRLGLTAIKVENTGSSRKRRN